MVPNRTWLSSKIMLACIVACTVSMNCHAFDNILGKELNPAYCKAHPADPDCPRVYQDAAQGTCTTNADCMSTTGVCDRAGSMMCVQCLAPDQISACRDATPVCGTNHACRACSTHTECPLSDACLPDGSCAATDQVAYVQAGGTGLACTKQQPCGTLDAGVKANKPYVKMATGTVADSQTTSIDGKTVTILADPGAKLGRSNAGVILEVKNNADVKIYDLEITGGTGIANAAISMPNGGAPGLALTRVTVDGNQGLGISSAAAGMLRVSQSMFSSNGGGGISVSGGQFDITNSFIVNNGGGASAFGGIKVDAITAGMASGMYRIDFNTIAQNSGPVGVDLGVSCGTVLVPVTVSNNIIYDNAVSGVGKQVSGTTSNCLTTYSDVGPDLAMGTGNINLAPMFVDTVGGNFHLMASSPAKDAADPNATLGNDFDGDVRPQPRGGRRDMGADEVRQ